MRREGLRSRFQETTGYSSAYRGLTAAPLHSAGGFTLIEILIALAIVGGLLITLIYTLNYHLGLVERQETVTVATFLAKDKLDDIEGDPENSKGYFEAPYEEYAYEISVKESQYPGISEIIVSVNKGNEEVKLNEFVIK